MPSNDQIVLYHYPSSPYARRILWYLALTQTPYAQVVQPPLLPRPDISLLSLSYRRIPVLALGRDIYCDTRLILPLLQSRSSSNGLASPAGATLSTLPKLLSEWTTNVVFGRASQLIPADLGFMNDERFRKDREQLSGRRWDRDALVKNRPEALVHIRAAFEVLEGLLSDGREWIAGKGEDLGMADIEAVWPFHWLITMPALPEPVISATHFPHVFAYVARFEKAAKAARAKAPKPETLKGEEAAQRIVAGSFASVKIDGDDPLGLSEGDMVEINPIDSGFTHKDRGELVGLDRNEVVLQSKTKSGAEVRYHFPRTGYRLKKVNGAKL